jgi:hypothetical protein
VWHGYAGSMKASIVTAMVGLVVAGCGADDPPRSDAAPARAETTRCEQFEASALVGLELADARRPAAREGCSLRVVIRDGRRLIRRADLRKDRINVATRDRVIVRVVGVF